MCRPLKPRDKKRVHTWMTSYRRTLLGRLFVAAPVAFTVRKPVPLLPLAFESFDTSGIEFVYMLFTVVSTRQLAGLRCGSLDEYSSDSFVLQMLQMMRTDAQGNCKSYKCGDGFWWRTSWLLKTCSSCAPAQLSCHSCGSQPGRPLLWKVSSGKSKSGRYYAHSGNTNPNCSIFSIRLRSSRATPASFWRMCIACQQGQRPLWAIGDNPIHREVHYLTEAAFWVNRPGKNPALDFTQHLHSIWCQGSMSDWDPWETQGNRLQIFSLPPATARRQCQIHQLQIWHKGSQLLKIWDVERLDNNLPILHLTQVWP